MRVLHAQIDRELDRLLQAVGGEPGQVQVGEPAPVEPFLDAGDALVVDIDVADEVRDLGAVRIDALVLRAGSRCREGRADGSARAAAAVISRLSQTKRRFEAEPLAQLGGVEIGHDRGEQLGRLVDVDDAVRLAEQRGHAHVGRQDFAVAVEDVGPRGRHRVVRDGAPRRS